MPKKRPTRRGEIKGLRKKPVRSRSTKHVIPSQKKKGTVKGSKPTAKPKSKNPKTKAKPAKTKAVKPKKTVVAKGSSKGSKAKSSPAAPKKQNDSLYYYNQLKKYVSEHLKEHMQKDVIGRSYLESKTMAAFTHFKNNAPKEGFNKQYLQYFVNNLDQFVTKPTIESTNRQIIGGTSDGFNYWLIEEYFDSNEADLRMFKKISIDMEDMLGANEVWEANDPNDFNFVEIRRSVANLVARMKRKGKSSTNKYYAYFQIYRDPANNEIIFVLTDTEPEEIIDEDDMSTPDLLEEALTGELTKEPEPTTKGKKGKKEKEKPAKAEPEQKLTPMEKAQLAREEKKGSLDLLTSKRESFEKSISFNNKQIREYAETIKILKEIGVNFKDEIQQVKDLQATNKKLMVNIDKINQQINDL